VFSYYRMCSLTQVHTYATICCGIPGKWGSLQRSLPNCPSVQVCPRHTYKAYIQGMHIRHTYKAYIQDMHIRHTYKAYIQGMHIRHTYKAYIQDMHIRHTNKAYIQDMHIRHTYKAYIAACSAHYPTALLSRCVCPRH